MANLATPPSHEIVEKLHGSRQRLANSALQALTLFEAWSALNIPSPARDALVHSPVTKAVGVMWQATQDSLVICLMRVLDEPGRSLHGSDRISFVVFSKLLDEEGVLDMLVRDAQSKVGPAMQADAGQAVIDAAARFRTRIDALANEDPNRVSRLRSIRDRFLAHQLDLDRPVPPPIYQNLRTLVDDVLALAEDATRVLQPTLIEWPRGEVGEESSRLVNVIAERYPRPSAIKPFC